jgi:N-acetylglucosamine-6-sulfatase
MRLRLTLTALLAAGLLAVASSSASAGPALPNVIVVTVDDQSMHTFTRKAMPHVFGDLVDHGTRFSNSFAAPPLCCPDRAGFLTGQYPHNNGVFSNRQGYSQLIEPENILPAWLHAAGYETALIGKYLNGTEAVLGATPAPGWDRWIGIASRPGYRRAVLSKDGEEVPLGDRYLTDVLNLQASRFVARAAAKPQPFFMWLTHFAPHTSPHPHVCPVWGAEPLEDDYKRVLRDRFSLPTDPSFNEDDVSDKPFPLNELPRLTKDQKREIRQRYRCAVAALSPVDRGVHDLVETLRETGQLRNTVILYTSDNGYEFGEHRLAFGKADVYEPSLRVPLVVRLPKSLRAEGTPSTVSDPVAEIDLAPTILAMAGGADPCTEPPPPEVPECRVMDGRSFLGLLQGGTSWPADRALLIELYRGAEARSKRPLGQRCHPLEGLRTPDWTMAIDFQRNDQGTCVDAGTELYDLSDDPYQLENVGSSPGLAGEVDALRARLEKLLGCSGIAGRDPRSGTGYCE